MSTPKYSVIIPVHNGSSRIGNTIESILRQTVSPDSFEIIVVDDASTDDTARVVQGYKTAHARHRIRCLRLEANRGPAAARNVGVQNARGSVFFFTDDDCEVPALWIENHATVYMRNPDVVAIGGWYVPLTRELRENRYQFFVYLWYNFLFKGAHRSLEGKAARFQGKSMFPATNTGNFSVKKYVVNIVGGFDERFTAPGSEDIEFSQRIRKNGFEMYYLPLTVVHHKDLGLSGIIRLARNRIKGRLVYEHVSLSRGFAYRDKTFLPLWINFRNYYIFQGDDKKHSTLTIGVLIVSTLYLFLVYSKIARWYWRRKLRLY